MMMNTVIWARMHSTDTSTAIHRFSSDTEIRSLRSESPHFTTGEADVLSVSGQSPAPVSSSRRAIRGANLIHAESIVEIEAVMRLTQPKVGATILPTKKAAEALMPMSAIADRNASTTYFPNNPQQREFP